MNSLSRYDIERSKHTAALIPSTASGAYALDLGCGTGIMSTTIRKKGYTYVGLDISRNSILKGHQSGKRNCDFLQGDAISLPFSRIFRLVTALEVIEHLEIPVSYL